MAQPFVDPCGRGSLGLGVIAPQAVLGISFAVLVAPLG